MNSRGIIRAQRGQSRMRRFLQKSGREKARSIFFHWVRAFPGIPIPIRLPFGAWWLARNDFVGVAMLQGGFENIERSFVECYLSPGMTVLDIGAHHGFYTLLASQKVGSKGKVIAVEASPRERKKLRLHLRINCCRNVTLEGRALGEAAGDAELYIVCGGQTGCNSLRKPEVFEPTATIHVRIERLDDVLREHEIEKVDFVKLDVEGAELSVLRGASRLLANYPRPVILAEVQDIRTRPWGYAARDIIRYLASNDYRWFRPLPDARLEEIDATASQYDGNFVAVPRERLASLSARIG
jgi:FkbM family methyltransferase